MLWPASDHVQRLWILLFLAAVSTPICGSHFHCGCAWPWEGWFFHCASLSPPRLPVCPWCEHAHWGLATMVAAAAAGLGTHRWLRERLRDSAGKPVRYSGVYRLVPLAAGILAVWAVLRLAGDISFF